MKGLNRALAFVLFLCLFTALALGVFGSFLSELALNVQSGSGHTNYLDAQRVGDTIYALGWRDGYRLSVYDGKLKQTSLKELPDCELDGFFAASDGSVLLPAYEYDGAKCVRFTLYVFGPRGLAPLISKDCGFETGALTRESLRVSPFTEAGGTVSFALLDDGTQSFYEYSPAKGEGLIPAGSEPYDRDDPVWQEAPKALRIEGYKTVYETSEEGESDLSALLYRRPWVSGLLLGLCALAALICAFICWYAVCGAERSYFPLVLRNFLLLSLVGFAVVSAALEYFIGPAYRAEVRASRCDALLVCTAQLADDDDFSAELAEARLAAADERYFDAVISLVPVEWWTGEKTAVVNTGDGLSYYACAPRGDEVVVARAAARFMEDEMDAALTRLALMLYAAALAVVLIAVFSFSLTAAGIRRVRTGVDLLNAGRRDVRVVNNSGDEVEALSYAFNDLTRVMDRTLTGAQAQSESYLRFLPEQLVKLLGVSSVVEITRSTTASRSMTMMMVWFSFPDHVYRSEADELFRHINEVIERTSGVVSKKGGTVYNFTYDGFDAVYDDARAAISTAVEIRQEILALNDERVSRSDALVTLRIAIAEGNVMMGVVGDQDRMVPTVVSASLNTARTLVSLCQTLDANILCTKKVADAAGEYALRYIGKCRDGRDSKRVYEIFDGDSYAMRSAKEMMRSFFAKGIYSLYERDFAGAKRVFMDLARQQNEDGVTRYYLYLADKFEREAPDEIYLN